MNILDIFYKNIILEAAKGFIESWFNYNIIFSTNILEDNKYYEATQNQDLFIPTLMIKDKDNFERLLKEYVYTALMFYPDTDFPEEILDYKEYNEQDRICKEKTIMAYLFANATADDFININQYIKRRIDFINNDYSGIYKLGFSNILNCDLNVYIEKDNYYNETPYKFTLLARNGLDTYKFPSIKFGVSEDTLYVYAIQNSKQDNTPFVKKINRLLYKVGEGFDTSYDNDEIYSSGNLKDITPSFLVSANVILSFFQTLGISNIVVPSILIERYNSKRSAILKQIKRYNLDEEKAKELEDEQIRIQTNLTEKFLRTFLRLAHHYENISVFAYPDDANNSLYLRQTGEVVCNNSLLLETNSLARTGFRKKVVK